MEVRNRAFLVLTVTLLCLCVGAHGKSVSTRFELRHSGLSGLVEWFENLVTDVEKLVSYIENSIICNACRIGADAFIWLLRVVRGDTLEALLYDIVAHFCTALGIESQAVCDGIVRINGPLFSYIAQNSPNLDGKMACGVLLMECAAGVTSLNWTIDLSFMGNKSDTKDSNSTSSTSTETPHRILQLSDYHWDGDYVVGSSIECDEPICCRSREHMASSPETGAGQWGEYHKCDVPWRAVEDIHRRTSESLNFDAVYFMGDIIDHAVWATSREKIDYVVKRTYRAMKETYGDIKVFPVVGNHESHPINAFAPSTVNDSLTVGSQWLYKTLADEWIKWWLPEDTRETIEQGGFYTVLVRPGLRVVSLNTMFCYRMNWWTMYDPIDLSGQLVWLAHVLLEAERASEKVHVLQHIPPGSSDCLSSWSKELGRITERFSNTITATFYGHTHKDDFKIYYSKDGKPNNVAFNGGSLTTYQDVNPNFKLYYVDRNTTEILDAEAWVFNITAANLLPPDELPEWFQIYSFKETFNVTSLRPAELEQFVARLARNTTLQQIYFRDHYLDSDVAEYEDCDSACAESLICQIVTTVSGDDSHCAQFFE